MSAPTRPNFIDLRSQSQASVSRPLKSPRLHVAGEVPPELSPLDAFALQSRLLAKQLQESAKADHRVSRLPPLTTDSPLVMQGRREYFRSMSYDDTENGTTSPNRSNEPQSATSQPPLTPSTFNMKTPAVEEPTVRPQSMHPRMSRIPPTPDNVVPPPIPEYARGRQVQLAGVPSNVLGQDDEDSYFGARRDRSPSPFAEDNAAETQRQRDLAASSLEAGSSSALEPTIFEEEPVPSRHTSEMFLPPPSPHMSQPPLSPSFQSPILPPHHPSSSSVPHPIYTGSNAYPLGNSPERSSTKNSFDSASGGLAPPRPIFPKRSSSIMSSPLEPTEEDGHSVMSASFYSQGAPPRKLSASSGLPSPGFGSFQRSPSIGSDMSAPLPRPSFNFSRPLSRAGTPGLDSPARQASSDSQTTYSQSSLILADDAANTPISMSSDTFPDGASFDENRSVPPSYIYSKFSLPRGKMLQRNGPQQPDNQPQASYHWDQPMAPPSNVQTLPLVGQAPPSPPTRPCSSSGMLPRPSLERSKLSTEVLAPTGEPSPDPSRPSTDGERSSEDAPRGRPMTSVSHDSPMRGRTPMSTTATSDSASTIKPTRSLHSLASAVDIPADEHVEKAIALHEKGQLNESTYHLRLAARQGHPTGMLLYALACRHGWGMRASPREGAEWLRKAADCASLEIADDEAQIKEGKMVDSLDRKTRKAQFALSIYELGVSYMNGWGIDQDKALALRCFEIAGSWGDVDALAEAGFCYAQGIGCKKNLKQSSKFYRQAEAKGMSMVGNSWIHKSKYNDDKEANKSNDKVRSKSRSRGIFGKKHNS